jgi:WD40 repeat protein
VSVWDANDGREITSFDVGGQPNCLTISVDGNLVAVGTRDGQITLFDVAKRDSLHQFQGHPYGLEQVALTPDSKTLASASWDSTVKLWNVATGQLSLTLQHLGPATDVTFSNDGRLMATCGADATARLWRAASLSEADESTRTERRIRSR